MPDYCDDGTPDEAGSFADVSYDFDAYTVGEPLAVEAGLPWTTWDYTPGTAKDPLISDAQSVSGTSSVYVENGDDPVLKLGTLSSGVYQIEYRVFVEAGRIASSNVLQRFWREDEMDAPGDPTRWGAYIVFADDGTGEVYGGDVFAPFTYTQDAWTAVEVTVDLDGNAASVSIDGNEVHSWDAWNEGADGNNDCLRLEGINVWGGSFGPSNPGVAGFYVDDVTVTKL